MGYKLTAQLVLIGASLVIIFTFTQPWLGDIKTKQDELLQYNEAVSKASQFNARLRELISIRDSFSSRDIQALEKFVPVQIDELKTMSAIAGIFSSRDVAVTSLTANEVMNPMDDVSLEGGIVNQGSSIANLAHQDFEVTFTAGYDELKDILMLTEASDALLEITQLEFGAAAVENADDASPEARVNSGDQYMVKIIFRTFGLPINTNV